MKRSLLLMGLLVVVVGCSTVPAKPAVVMPPAVVSEQDKTLYSLGFRVGSSIKGLTLTAEELKLVQRGIADAALGTGAAVKVSEYDTKVQTFARERMAKAAVGAKADSAAFLEKAAKEEGAMVTES